MTTLGKVVDENVFDLKKAIADCFGIRLSVYELEQGALYLKADYGAFTFEGERVHLLKEGKVYKVLFDMTR